MERPKAPREPRRRKATDHQGRGVWGGCVFPMCVFFTYKSVHLGLTPAFSFFWGGEKWRTIGQSDSRQNRKYLYRDQSPSRRDRHLWQRVIYRDRCAACTPCSLCGPYSSISVLYSDVDMTSVLFRYYSRDHVMLCTEPIWWRHACQTTDNVYNCFSTRIQQDCDGMDRAQRPEDLVGTFRWLGYGPWSILHFAFDPDGWNTWPSLPGAFSEWQSAGNRRLRAGRVVERSRCGCTWLHEASNVINNRPT